jgi:uncharacterized protein YbjT (DUF2867 family)
MFFSTLAPDRKLPTCATSDIATVAAGLLLDDSWSGQDTVAVLGPEDLSHNEMAGIISDVLGKPVSYAQVPIDAFRQQLVELGTSEAMAEGMVRDDGRQGPGPGQRRAPHATVDHAHELSPMVRRGAASGRDRLSDHDAPGCGSMSAWPSRSSCLWARS